MASKVCEPQGTGPSMIGALLALRAIVVRVCNRWYA